jgi:hypothetical protein
VDEPVCIVVQGPSREADVGFATRSARLLLPALAGAAGDSSFSALGQTCAEAVPTPVLFPGGTCRR